MTIQTLGIFGMNSRGMRFTMTNPALGDDSMNFPVAESAGIFFMLCPRLLQCLANIGMTGKAVSVRRGKRIFNIQGIMGRMAIQTLIKGLFLGMFFMTRKALGNFSMFGMTTAAGKV